MCFFEASSKENVDVYPIFNFLASKAVELHRNEIYERRMVNNDVFLQKYFNCFVLKIF